MKLLIGIIIGAIVVILAVIAFIWWVIYQMSHGDGAGW